MSISVSSRMAYAEIDVFLELVDAEDREKIPKNLRELFKREKDKGYIKSIDSNIPISEQNLKEETLAIIALLNLKYWCDDETEKERLKKVYKENEIKYNSEINDNQVGFDFNDILQDEEENEVSNNKENSLVVNTNVPLYKRIINNIIKIFKR